MKHFCFLITILFQSILFSQVTENFSDGDFTNNPTWVGTDADFMVNPTKQLQSNATIQGASYLSTSHLLNDFNSKEWSFYAKQSFAGSGSNYSRIYLVATSANLLSNPDGYYIQLGEAGSTDAIRLFKRVNGVSSEVMAATVGAITNSVNAGIRVVYNASGWSLYVDYNGGTNYTLEATNQIDIPTNIGTHFGALCVYTASNATKFIFDDFYVGNEILDVAAPTISSVNVIDATNVNVIFSETVTTGTASVSSNFSISNGVTISGSVRDASDLKMVRLSLSTPLTNGTQYTLTVSGISDLAGNVMTSPQTMPLILMIGETPVKGDVVITEIFCRVTPTQGLPEKQYIEIYNRSNKIFNIENWRILDNTSSSNGKLGAGWILPGEYKVLCATANVVDFPGSIGCTSYPSFNQTGDDVIIKDANGNLIDKVTYSDSWYQDNVKKEGGYSIEKINPLHPCSDDYNWIASNASIGGTPGAQNSVYDITPNTTLPSIVQIYTTSPNSIDIQFNKGMDSLSLSTLNILTNPSLTVLNRVIPNATPLNIQLDFVELFDASTQYNIVLENAADCWSNVATISGNFILPELAEKGDVVINEILFNPLTGGADFVELYNNSDRTIDLKDWELANFKNGFPANNKKILSHYILEPKEYVVITGNPNFLIQAYPAAVPNKSIELALPSYNNDSSTVYLLQNLEIMDKVSYSEKWHFALLSDKKGKSLERISPTMPSNSASTWHTAAEAIGFATPGRENSQFIYDLNSGDFTLNSETISPDNDGFEDVLVINYEMLEPQMIATITIFDDRGKIVKDLVKNEILGAKGSFVWDGFDNKGQKAHIGPHVIFLEAYSQDGKSISKKKVCTVAGKLN